MTHNFPRRLWNNFLYMDACTVENISLLGLQHFVRFKRRQTHKRFSHVYDYNVLTTIYVGIYS